MAAFSSVKDLFDNIQTRFRPEKAQGDKAVLAFELSGQDSGSFWMKIDNGTLEVGEGTPPAEADLILKAAGEDFVRIMNGEMNPMMAFMQGKVKAERNMGMAMKLMGWFGM
jgi:putative sterol carrier protein